MRLVRPGEDSEDVVPGPLYAAQGDPLTGVVLGVVNVTVLHEGDVQSGNVSVVSEYPKNKIISFSHFLCFFCCDLKSVSEGIMPDWNISSPMTEPKGWGAACM